MIELFYGDHQRFRYRYDAISIVGRTDGPLPVDRAEYCLNSSPPVAFYVEPHEPAATPARFIHGTKTRSIFRLKHRPGEFVLEIPVDHANLISGTNLVRMEIAARGETALKEVTFDWDPRPVPLPLKLTELPHEGLIQDIGQVVDGRFDIRQGVIRSHGPVGADVLLLLGSPHGSQEATYDVRFTDERPAIPDGLFLGLSDFFVDHEEQSPGLGIKPGYSTAGLATIDPEGSVRLWMMWGDLLMDNPRSYRIVNDHDAAIVRVRRNQTYRVRHQIVFGNDFDICRIRIWPKGRTEPRAWLCEQHNQDLGPDYSRFTRASFGLFQFGGSPTEWSNLELRSIDEGQPPVAVRTELSGHRWKWRRLKRHCQHALNRAGATIRSRIRAARSQTDPSA